MHLFWSYFLILNCRIHVAWLTGRRIEFLVAKCISSLTLGKTQKSLFKITYKPKLYFCYYWIATVFIWHIRNSSHKNVRCKCCTFLGHDEKQRATIREPEIPCNINFSERKKKQKTVAEIVCSPVAGCISSGNLTRGQTSLPVLWISNTRRKNVGLKDRQTDRNKGTDGDRVSSLSAQHPPTSV